MKRMAALALGLAIACGTTSVDAHQTLVAAGAAVGRLTSVTGELDFSAGAVSFQGYALTKATTKIHLPGQSDTTYYVRSGDASFSIEALITGGTTYLALPFLGFSKLSAGQASDIPDLSQLFDKHHGLPAVIPAGTKQTYVTDESEGGVQAHKVTTVFTKAQVAALLPQLSSSGDVNVTVWSGVNDNLVRKALLDGPFGTNGTHATVTVTLSGFDSPVSISPPS